MRKNPPPNNVAFRFSFEADDVRQRMVIIAVIFTIISAFFFFLVYLDKRSKQAKKESTA